MTFTDYVAHGWSLCAIDPGKKAPTYALWNEKPLPADAVEGIDGAGLLHALSGTCAIDIDNLAAARPWLLERGVDIDTLLEADDAVRIDSGRQGRAKLLYRMKRPLRTYKPKGSGLELRCATAEGKSVQDVLPPSIHPETKKPYEWAGGILSDWRSLPPIPASLLTVWRGLGADDAETIAPPAERPRVDLVKLRKAAFAHSPDCEYDEWLKVAMQLHDGTGGAQEGFDIWCDWSRKITRAAYPGDVTLKSHWLSFDSGQGKHVASGEALAAELPAEADDFEIMPVIDMVPAPVTGIEAVRKAALVQLIERFVFIIWEQEYFDTERHSIIGDKAIRHLLTPYMPKTKRPRDSDPVDQLMRSSKKAAVEALAFHPGETAIFTYNNKRYANTFFDKMPAPLEPRKDELDKINWLFGRIDDVAYCEWLLQFYAHMVQHPGVKIRTAPLIWSEIQGNGKSTIVGTIPKLLVGEDYYTEVTQGELNSDHNDFLIGKWHITLAEFRAGTRGEREAISKKVENWIADDVLAIHPKGTKGYSIPNHLVVTASTNKDDAAAIDQNDRKWAVHKLNVPAMTSAEKDWLFTTFLRTARGPAVLRHFFLNLPITTFDPHADAPRTEARTNMVESSIALDLELLITAFEERAEPLSKGVVLARDVGDYVRRNCAAKPSNERIGKLLCGPPFNGAPKKIKLQSGAQFRVITFDRKWLSAPAREIMEHINGNDIDIDILS